MKRLLLALPVLLGSLIAPAGASAAVEQFGYEAGYKACIRDRFNAWVGTRQKWNSKSNKEKDATRAAAHKVCK